MTQLSFWLKVSRPGLWFATIWLYLLPTGQMQMIWEEELFWLGFIYVCFPLNFLVYGWNDIADREIDQINPRKGNYLFGAKGSKEQLASLWKVILIVQLLFIPFFIYLDGAKMLLLFTGLLLVNALYNWPKHGLRSKPPWELLCQFGYLLVVPFSIWLNDTQALPALTYVYLLLFAIQSHLMGEVMDIVPDKAAGRKTTATLLGMKSTKLLIIAVVSAEVTLLFLVFKTYIFGGLLLMGLVWLLLDLFLIFKTKTYTMGQMKLFGYGSNAIALASMIYVWYSGVLLQIP